MGGGGRRLRPAAPERRRGAPRLDADLHVEERWSPYGFVRIHRGYLVPVRAITEFAVIGGNHTVTVAGRSPCQPAARSPDVRERFLQAADGR